MRWWFPVLVLPLMGSECLELREPLPVLVGQLAFPSSARCTSPVSDQRVTRDTCNTFLRRIDPGTGAPAQGAVEDPLRALPAEVWLFVRPAGGDYCWADVMQTREWGAFGGVVEGCDLAVGQAIEVIGLVNLRYTVGYQGQTGTVQAFWRLDEADDLWPDGDVPTTVEYTDGDGHVHGTPTFRFTWSGTVRAGDLVALNVGTRIVEPGGGAGNPLGYLDGVLETWATVVELHRRLAQESLDPARWAANLFRDPEPGRLEDIYRVEFTTSWPNAGLAVMRTFGPAEVAEAGALETKPRGWLFDTRTVAHEFGHSVQRAFAPDASVSDYSFANPKRWSDARMAAPDPPANQNYDWGHTAGQHQELGTAFVEGVANPLGQYLINRCDRYASDRVVRGGRTDAYTSAIWAGDASCDASSGCYFHNLRWALWDRGVEEGDGAFVDRVAELRAMHRTAPMVPPYVLSHQEARMATLGCDLLDDDPSAGHLGLGTADDLATSRPYLFNATYTAAQILDGVLDEAEVLRSYPATLPAETGQVTYRQYLDALDATCCAAPVTAGGTWGAAYNRDRVDLTTAPMAGQRLVDTLVQAGHLTRSEGDAALIHNLMELD